MYNTPNQKTDMVPILILDKIDLETRGKIEHFIIVRKSVFRGLDSPYWFFTIGNPCGDVALSLLVNKIAEIACLVNKIAEIACVRDTTSE